MSRSRSVPRASRQGGCRNTDRRLQCKNDLISLSLSALEAEAAQTQNTQLKRQGSDASDRFASAEGRALQLPPIEGIERIALNQQTSVGSPEAVQGKPLSPSVSSFKDTTANIHQECESVPPPLAPRSSECVADDTRQRESACRVTAPSTGGAVGGSADVATEDPPQPPLTEALRFTVERLTLPGAPPSRVRHVATNGRYLVTKTEAAALSLWRLRETGGPLTAQPMQSIQLPHGRVGCLALQDICGHLLVTCSRNILLWDLSEPSRAPLTLGEDFSGVSCCHLSAGGEAAVARGAAVLSLGVSHAVWLLDTVHVHHMATLRGHECDVTSVTVQGGFCAAGSEAGQVKVWELSGRTLLYSSQAVAPRSVGAVSVDPLSDLVAAGCGSQITVAAAAAAGRWTDVTSTDLERPPPDGGSVSPRPECAVLSVEFMRRPSSAVFGPDSLLLASTTCGLSVLNTRTWLPLHTEANDDGEPWGGSSVALTPGGAAVVFSRSALRGRIAALWLNVEPLADREGHPRHQRDGLSIVCRQPLPVGSVLRARRTAAVRPSPPSISRVRSSGYGTPPRRTMFQPRTNTGPPRPAKAASSRLSLSSLPAAAQRPAKSRDRPTLQYRCHVVTPPTGSRPVRILRPGDTLLRVALSGSGRQLACSSQRGPALEVARLHQLDVVQDQFLLGTQGAILSVAWSLSGNRLAAVSSAGVQLWSVPGGELRSRRPVGDAPFTAAQFFFTDEFLLASHGATVELSRLPPERASPTGTTAHSGGGGGTLRPVLQCRLPCRQVLHVAGACQLRSALAVACCSDHALRVVDVQGGRVALTIPGAHRRPAHLARLCEGSPHLSAALPLYDLVGSAAVGDGVRLWDVRSGRLAARLPAADLRALPAGFQFSPCGRLVALGSDSAHVWLWDVRAGRGPLARLRAAAPGVSDVAFHPRRPGLVSALLDGTVQTWSLDGSGGQ